MSYFSQREVVGGSVVLAFGLAVGGFLESKLHLFSGSSYKGLEGTVAVQSVSPQNGQEQSGTEDGLRKSIKGNPVKLVKSEISVHDGDTIKYHGESFRLAGIDCAEVKNSWWPDQYGVGEFSNIDYGEKGRAYVVDAIQAAQRVDIIRVGKDKYERTLAYVLVDDKLLQAMLVADNLAYESVSHFGDNGEPDLARKITGEWDKLKGKDKDAPHFEEPYKWRKEHQGKKKGKDE